MSEFDVASSNIDEVKAHVEKNPDQLQAVLDAEKGRSGGGRKTLLAHLEELAAQTPRPSEPSPVEVTPSAPSSDTETVTIAGQEYTVDPQKGYRVKAGQPSG